MLTKKIWIIRYSVNMYHDAKQRRNSHTSGTSCTILTDQHSTGQDGGPAAHHPWSSSSLVSASTRCTWPLPLLITTCHLLPKNTGQMLRCRGRNRHMASTDRESRLGPHRAQLSNAAVYDREVGTTLIPLAGPITWRSKRCAGTSSGAEKGVGLRANRTTWLNCNYIPIFICKYLKQMLRQMEFPR